MRLVPEFVSKRMPFVNKEQGRSNKIDYAQFTKEKLVSRKIISAFINEQGIHVDYADRLEKDKYYRFGLRAAKGDHAGKIPIYLGADQENVLYSGQYFVSKSHLDYTAVYVMLESEGFLS